MGGGGPKINASIYWKGSQEYFFMFYFQILSRQPKLNHGRLNGHLSKFKKPKDVTNVYAEIPVSQGWLVYHEISIPE